MGGGGNELQRLSAGENLMLGLVAGMTCKTINYPLLNWKNTVQQGLPISFNPKVVYRGLPMAMINLGGTTAIQFWATGMFQKLLATGKKLSNNQEMAAAFLGGLTSGVPCSLYELTMIQQQRFGGSLIGTPIRLVKEFGPMVLTRGVTTSCGRESLYTLAMLGFTPVIQRTLIESYYIETSMALATGSLIGAFVSATISHPMDTIKTCMQGDCAGKKYTTVTKTGNLLIEEYGVAKGLFKGLSWRIGLIATTFFLVNKLKEVYAPLLFPEPPQTQIANKAAEK